MSIAVMHSHTRDLTRSNTFYYITWSSLDGSNLGNLNWTVSIHISAVHPTNTISFVKSLYYRNSTNCSLLLKYHYGSKPDLCSIILLSLKWAKIPFVLFKDLISNLLVVFCQSWIDFSYLCSVTLRKKITKK